jgi:DNA-binding CsgD family transcriptional regulator
VAPRRPPQVTDRRPEFVNGQLSPAGCFSTQSGPSIERVVTRPILAPRTYVNQERVHSAWLTDSDELQIGRLRFAIRLGRPVAEAHRAAAGARSEPAGPSEVQIEVSRLVAAGLSDPGIAADLGIGTAEVGAHLEDNHRRLDVASRASVAAFARGQGYAT